MSTETETQNSESQATSTSETSQTLVTGETTTTNQDTQGSTTETEGETSEEAVKTPEEIAEEAAKAEADAAAAAPITVEDIVLPEGMAELSPDLTKEFVELVNDKELGPKARAEALLNLQAKAMTAASEASSAAWTEMQEQWRNEVKADPVVGGDKLQPTLNSINKLVTEHGDEKLVEALAVTGAGNNLHVIKFLHTVSTLLTEGGYQAGSPAGQEKTAAQRLYPSMPN